MMGVVDKLRKLPSFVWVVLLAVLAIFASGCYEVEQEVIRATEAVSIYGLPGTYTGSGPNEKTTISAVPNSNDYRFQWVTKNKVSSGYFRAIPLRGNIYIVQVKYDNESVYYLMFYKFTSDASGKKNFTPLRVDDPVYDLAQQYGVKIDIGEYGDVFGGIQLVGSRSDIIAFLRAHRNLSLSPDVD